MFRFVHEYEVLSVLSRVFSRFSSNSSQELALIAS